MIVWIIAAVAVLFIVLVFVTGYVKASPDTAYIISGLRKTPKVLIGKAGVKIPFFEKKDELSLQLIPIASKHPAPCLRRITSTSRWTPPSM